MDNYSDDDELIDQLKEALRLAKEFIQSELYDKPGRIITQKDLYTLSAVSEAYRRASTR